MTPKGLEHWVRSLTQNAMPVLSKVITELNAITGRDDAEIQALAELILKDPNLTTQVLRVSNSVFYNPTSTRINTISRAIVLIGFKKLRSICISLILVDRLLTKTSRQRILRLVAQGFHAAAQAQHMLDSAQFESAEEVFIAALLFNLGEMAYLANFDIDDTNKGLLSDDAKERERSMESILGTSFKAITRGLAKTWKLGDTLEVSLYPGLNPPNKIKAVIWGESLSRAALEGWESPKTLKLLEELAETTGQSVQDCLVLAQDTAEKAAEIASHYGVAEASAWIPTVKNAQALLSQKNTPKVAQLDTLLQLSIMRELTMATVESSDVNAIFQMVLEGMHRGIGLDRVALGFVQNNVVMAKYMLGEGTESWHKLFKFNISPATANRFAHAVAQPNGLLLNRQFLEKTLNLADTEPLQNLLGKGPAVIYPIRIVGRVPAIFYGDCCGNEISQEQFEYFKHFAMQAQICLSYLSQAIKK